MAQRLVPLDLLPWAMASLPPSSAREAICDGFGVVAVLGKVGFDVHVLVLPMRFRPDTLRAPWDGP